MQLGFRFYDPQTGRFTQLDPIGDGLNWYAYCGGNPKNGADPWGLDYKDAIGILDKWNFAINDVAESYGIRPELLGGVVYNEMYAGGLPQWLNEYASIGAFIILGRHASIGITQYTLFPNKMPSCSTFNGRIEYISNFKHGTYAEYEQLLLGASKLKHLVNRRYKGEGMKLTNYKMSIILTEYNKGESPNGIVNNTKPKPSAYGRQGIRAMKTIRRLLTKKHPK